MALGIFTSSVLGMEAQSHALQTVSQNMANMNTVGYKANDTMFYTLLGSQPVVKGNNMGISSSRSDIGGVGYYDRTKIDTQGLVKPTAQNYDVAINGTGNAFFLLKDASNKEFLTRAGDFQTRTQNGVTYLISSSGLKVQGFPALENGGFGGSPEDIIIKYPEKVPSTPTSKAEITANVPATGVDSSSYGITVYGPNNDGATMNMLFKKIEGRNNAWEVSFNVDGGTVSGGPIEAIFDTNGELLSPKNFDISVNWEDGSSNNISMDISHMTQLAGGTGITHVSQDGAMGGNFVKSFVDTDGIVKASYSNGKTINQAKLALLQYTAPNNLTPISGTLFEANLDAGESRFVDDPKNYLVSQALEQSTVNVEEEFSRLVVVQRAYTLNSQSFSVGDEMLQTAVSLKT